MGNLATGGARNTIQMQALLFPQAAKHTAASSFIKNNRSKAPTHTQRRSGTRSRFKTPLTKSPLESPSKLRMKPEEVRHKRTRPEPIPPKPVEPILENSAQKIAYFQGKLLEIREGINNQITIIDGLTRTLGVENDRLHPLVHCKHILRLDTSSILQELLQAIDYKTDQDRKHPTLEDTAAFWLESRILAVQLWVTKRLLLQIQSETETESGAPDAHVRAVLQDIETQISGMSLVVAILRDRFHRVRPQHVGPSPNTDWAKKFLIKEESNDALDDSTLKSTIQLPNTTPSQSNSTGALVSQSILLENLAIIAAYSKQESIIWKIERFLSRIEEVYLRVSRVTGLLDQLAGDLQVTEDRTHPVVSCKRVLQLDSFSSLDMVLRILRKRTPRNQVELNRGMGEVLWLDSRLPEVQLEVVKMRLWGFHETMKSQNLPHRQKSLIRSIRGRIKVSHSLLRNSRKEFGSYGPQGKFEVDGGVSTEEK